jgi:hypothetical protein
MPATAITRPPRNGLICRHFIPPTRAGVIWAGLDPARTEQSNTTSVAKRRVIYKVVLKYYESRNPTLKLLTPQIIRHVILTDETSPATRL